MRAALDERACNRKLALRKLCERLVSGGNASGNCCAAQLGGGYPGKMFVTFISQAQQLMHIKVAASKAITMTSGMVRQCKTKGSRSMRLQWLSLFGFVLPVALSVVVTDARLASATAVVTAPALTSSEFAKATKDFDTYCSVCHGSDARGLRPGRGGAENAPG